MELVFVNFTSDVSCPESLPNLTTEQDVPDDRLHPVSDNGGVRSCKQSLLSFNNSNSTLPRLPDSVSGYLFPDPEVLPSVCPLSEVSVHCIHLKKRDKSRRTPSRTDG